MQKKFRKVLSLVLALTMVFAIGLTANAAGKNDSGWGDYRYWSTWGNWNESDNYASVPTTFTSDPSSYYMPERSDENKEMAPAFYKEKSYFPTTIPGVYAVSSVPVALRTPAYQLLNKFGLKEGFGLIARFYDLPKQSVNAKAMLDAKAAELGATVVGYFDGSLAVVDSNDKLTELAETDETIDLFLGIGSNNPNYELCAIRVQEGGKVAVLEDQHLDTNILSIKTTPNVASYAVVCKPAGAVAVTAAPAAETPAVAAPAADMGALSSADAAFIGSLSEAQMDLLAKVIASSNFSPDGPEMLAFIASLNADQLKLILNAGK